MTAISVQGDQWNTDGVSAGLTRRCIDRIPSDLLDHVAPECRHWKMIKYYADYHDVDEDRATIVNFGGWWGSEDGVGVTCRDVSYDQSPTSYVAYKDKNTILSSRMVFLMI